MKKSTIIIIVLVSISLLFVISYLTLAFKTISMESCSEDFLLEYNQAVLEGNQSFCDEFRNRRYIHGNPAYLSGCLLPDDSYLSEWDCYVDIAKTTQNISVCDGTSSSTVFYSGFLKFYTEACFENVENLTQNADWCNGLYVEDECLSFIAKETNDSILCQNIEKGYFLRDSCYTYFGLNRSFSLDS